MQFIPAVKPESIGEQFIRSFKLYITSLLHVLAFALCLSIVVFIPRILLALNKQSYLLGVSLLNPQTWFLILVDLVALVLFTAILWRIKCLIISRKESVFEDFKTAFKKLPLIVVAALIQTLLFVIVNIVGYAFILLLEDKGQLINSPVTLGVVGCVFVLQFLAVLYIYILFFFYLPLILTENKNPLPALKKSVRLVLRNWWRTLIVQSLPWICFVLVLILLRSFLDLDITIYFFQPRNHRAPMFLLVCRPHPKRAHLWMRPAL